MTDNTELLPCPFCGGEAEVCEGDINGRMRVYGLVEHKDGCLFLVDGLPTKYQHIMESEFEAWNARAERPCECVSEYAESPFDGKTIVLHRCSECHKLMRPHMRYCPNCGARRVDA